MSRRASIRWWLVLGGSIIAAAFITLLIFGIFGGGASYLLLNISPTYMAQNEAKIQAELEAEFKSISPLPGAAVLAYQSCTASTGKDKGCSGTPGRSFVMVYASYPASFRPTDVFKHYDQQLRARGWQFGDTSKTDWNADLSNGQNRYATYCKQGNRALLSYYLDSSSRSWRYSLALDWGFSRCD